MLRRRRYGAGAGAGACTGLCALWLVGWLSLDVALNRAEAKL